MQLEEEEQNRKRAANRTALEAIGGPRKKRKLDEALESLQNAQTPGTNNTSSTSLSTSNATTNQVYQLLIHCYMSKIEQALSVLFSGILLIISIIYKSLRVVILILILTPFIHFSSFRTFELVNIA